MTLQSVYCSVTVCVLFSHGLCPVQSRSACCSVTVCVLFSHGLCPVQSRSVLFSHGLRAVQSRSVPCSVTVCVLFSHKKVLSLFDPFRSWCCHVSTFSGFPQFSPCCDWASARAVLGDFKMTLVQPQFALHRTCSVVWVRIMEGYERKQKGSGPK